MSPDGQLQSTYLVCRTGGIFDAGDTDCACVRCVGHVIYQLQPGQPGFDWVGLKNYEAIGKYSSYKKMFSASLTYVLIVVPVSVALGLGAALLISTLRFGGEVYKAVFSYPSWQPF